MKDEVKNWQVTRFCCTSGMCLQCRGLGVLERRKRIIHADNVTKEIALKMEAGWPSYGAKASEMPKK